MLRIKNPYTKHCRIANPAERKRSPAEHKGFFWGTEGKLLGGLREVRKAGKFKERTAE